MKQKFTVAVLFGGCSSEYEISLQSAYAVIQHMDKDKFNPILIGITKQGDWYCFEGNVEKILSDTWWNTEDCVPAVILPNRTKPTLLKYTETHMEQISIDAAFPVLHGKHGEDGTVQGLCELAGIPVVGCGVLSSALCMDKDRAHQLVATSGIKVPQSIILKKGSHPDDKRINNLGFPVFVKPVKAGSSFGVTKVSHPCELSAAIQLAFEYDDCIIIEENIVGFEVGCAILGKDELIVGEVDEIELTEGFFDFTEKYTLKNSAIHVPARIDEETSKRIKQTAQVIYKVLDCKGFARVDMFLTPSKEIVFNEVNTIPGFTSHSRFPNMLKAVGFSFEQIVTTAIEQAVIK